MSDVVPLISLNLNPRHIDEDVPLPDSFTARFEDVDIVINNPERTTALDLTHHNVYAHGLRIYGVPNPMQITGGTRHYLGDIEFHRD